MGLKHTTGSQDSLIDRAKTWASEAQCFIDSLAEIIEDLDNQLISEKEKSEGLQNDLTGARERIESLEDDLRNSS